MARKEFTYRGKTLDELQGLSTEEVVKLLPARARRAMVREPNHYMKRLQEDFQDAIQAKEAGKQKRVKTHYRDLVILPKMVGLDVEVYNGRKFEKFTIKPGMIGFRLGDFSLSKKKVNHGSAGIGSTGGSRHVGKK